MEEPKYIYSQLSPYSAGRLIELHYNLSSPVSCKYYVLGLHDNYLIDSKKGRFILRIYRNDWRTEAEIFFELELLTFLSEKTTHVAYPLLTLDGEFYFFIDSPEGKRTAALFHYADGHAPENKISAEESKLLGNVVATIHGAGDIFVTSNTRSVLDIPYLLDQSLITIEPFIDSESQTYLKTLQTKIHRDLPSLPHEAGIFGICTGDINPQNFHINSKNKITLFDFDQCGYGYRAFEIGKFLSSIHSLKTKNKIGKAFIEGYQDVRRLITTEVQSIPYFEMISVIWVMAIHAKNADRIGHKWLEKPFWDKRLDILKELDSS